MPQLLSQDVIISRFNAKHNNFYDYSLMDYKGVDDYIEIICPIHGIFHQRVDHHANGSGCKKCSRSKANEVIKKSKKEFFIDECKKIHNDFYDYSKTIYTAAKKSIRIICPLHGEFEQRAYNHKKGHGCMRCVLDSNKQIYLHEDWIIRFNRLFNDEYDYSLNRDISYNSKLYIICKKHGLFIKRLSNHFHKKQGCPHCIALSNGENKIFNILNAHNISFTRQKTFKDCFNVDTGRRYKFDFFLTDFNILIEYDGRQHFNPVDFFGGENAFRQLQKSDEYKNLFAEKSNIKLYRICYLDDIESKLKDIIKIIPNIHKNSS